VGVNIAFRDLSASIQKDHLSASIASIASQRIVLTVNLTVKCLSASGFEFYRQAGFRNAQKPTGFPPRRFARLGKSATALIYA
jgi:hypothetical protein